MLLEAQKLSGGYAGGFTLREVSVSVDRGQILTLVGPNGSGKSTLLRMLAGQLPCEGNLKWDGRELLSRRELARLVGYLPQFPTYEPGQTVYETLRLGRLPYLGAFGFESAADVAVVESTIKRLGLAEFKRRAMDELSGGQRQRVFLGRCLIQQPVLMLMDEPTSSLDLKHQAELARLLRELKDEGLGIVIAVHDLNLAEDLGGQTMLLAGGKCEAVGAAQDVLRPETISRIYGVRVDRAIGLRVRTESDSR